MVLELTEAATLSSLLDGVPPQHRSRLGVGRADVGGITACFLRADRTGFYSRALGVVRADQLSQPMLDRLRAFYAEQGAPTFTLQVPPSRLPSWWGDLCSSLGITPRPPRMKLAGPLDGMTPRLSTDTLSARPVAQREVAGAVALFAVQVGMDPGLLVDIYGPALAAGVLSGWVVDVEGEVAALGLLRAGGAVAHLCGAGTRADRRGRGAQTALLRARVDAAASAGCTTVVAETWKPQDGQVNPSLDNLRRAGLAVAYERATWEVPTSR